MRDTSDYTLEERIAGSVWIHKRPQTGKSMRQVRDDFGKKTSTKANTFEMGTQTFANWECKG